MGRRRAKSVTGPKRASAVEPHVRITRYNTKYSDTEAFSRRQQRYIHEDRDRDRDRVPWIL